MAHTCENSSKQKVEDHVYGCSAGSVSRADTDVRGVLARCACVHLKKARPPDLMPLFLSMERVSLSISVIALVDCSRGERFIPGPSLGPRWVRIRACNRAFESTANPTGRHQVLGASRLLR